MFFSGLKSSGVKHSFKQLCLLFMMFFTHLAHAEEPLAKLHIDTSQDVVYCSTTPNTESKQLITLLNDGIPITFTWDISIEEVRDYWLNKDVGNVQFYRQIMPDLVSRQWILKDSNSGISRTTVSEQSAISFLAKLQHFPVIDKSLLVSGVTYQVRVRLYIEEGEVNENWWSNLTKLGKTIALGTFTLP